MAKQLIDKNKAFELRKQGLSYSEIQDIIPSVSKGLLSYWFRDIVLSPEQEQLINSHSIGKQNSGRIKSAFTNKKLRLNREIVAFEDAKRIFMEMHLDRSFLIGVALYWAEGAKKHGNFQFVNSDPDMIIFMYKWIQKYLDIDKNRIKCRLFIHRIPGYENIEMFWAGKLGVQPSFFQKTIYKPTIHSTKKNLDYHGCLRLCVTNVYVFRLMKAWQKLLMQYYGDMRP